ncbi:hypothetical protein [Lyngbya aestuarii]|uniref:hypothetical protein n=1 Tax=Lyngbya aestuarii TaxID=118322 RepID=UPI00403DB227
MPVKQSDYEALLAEYSNRDAVIVLLKKHRAYLEMIPSMRRPGDSLLTIPLPIVRIRQAKPLTENNGITMTAVPETLRLPCDLAILTCDPEWKIKMGVEILVFMHRPQEDFSHLLSRWRQTQVLLDQDYEWLMPPDDQNLLSEGANRLYPLFVLFPETHQRIRRGLLGACLPFVEHTPDTINQEETSETLLPEIPPT